MTRYVGPESIGAIFINDNRMPALLDTGSQVNTITPVAVERLGLSPLPISRLEPEGKGVRLGGLHGSGYAPQQFVVANLRTPAIKGFNEDTVFLVVPDESPWAAKIPVVIGTCSLDRMINVTRESELDALTGAYLMSYKTRLIASEKQALREKRDPRLINHRIASRPIDPTDLNEVLYTRNGEIIPAFQSLIVGCSMTLFLTGCRMNGMVVKPAKGEGRTFPGLQVINTMVRMKNGSNKVSVVLRNTTNKDIRVPPKAPIAKVINANVIPPAIVRQEDLSKIEEKVQDICQTGDEENEKTPLTEPERISKLLASLDVEGLQDRRRWSEKEAKDGLDTLLEFHDVFTLDEYELGCTSQIEHEIYVTDPVPFKERFRNIPPGLMEEVRKALREMIETGAIRPSNSPWCNAVVLAKKKDGSMRFCVDFRRLNQRTVKDSHPLPRINTVLEQLQGARYFSALDLKWGFWQVKMSEWSKKYTAFTIGHLGFWEFNRMPFGLCNAPSTFQRVMLSALGELHMQCCLVYLDDVIVYSKSARGHIDDLRLVFACLREHNLKLKPSKCKFFLKEIDYLAHHISEDGISPSRDNIQPILDYPVPKTFTEVRAFLGLAGHFRRFIRNFSAIARHLSNMLSGENASKKNHPCKLKAGALWSFRRLQRALVSYPVLRLPDYSRPFILETDASKFGLGAVLLQSGEDDNKPHPIAYASRTLKTSEQNYHSTKLEFLALKWAVTEKFADTLLGTEFEVITDANPLTYVMTTPNLDATGHRWVSALSNFSFSLTYRRGVDNRAADTLSRHPVNHRPIPDGEEFPGITDDESAHPEPEGSAAQMDGAEFDRLMDSLLDGSPGDNSLKTKGDSVSHTMEEVREMMEGSTVSAVSHRASLAGDALRALQTRCLEVSKELAAKVTNAAPRMIKTKTSDWVQAQCDDPGLAIIRDWMASKHDREAEKEFSVRLRQLPKRENVEYWRNRSNYHKHNDLVYLRRSLPNDPEAVDLFIVPRSLRSSALNGCHHEAGHQGRDRTISLVKERFWWPGYAADAANAVKDCKKCLRFEKQPIRAPMVPIVVYGPLDLVHLDYTSMETNPVVTDPAKPKDVLVITDHFTRYSLALVAKDQTARTTAELFFKRFISVFGIPRRIVSDRGGSFCNKIIEELCAVFGIDKSRTTAYHPQANGQVERFHQTLCRMLGKEFVPGTKWENHLEEVCLAYNATRSAVTGYSPYFLMFGRRPRIPVDFLFPTSRNFERSQKVPQFIAELKKRLDNAFELSRAIASEEAKRQKQKYDIKTSSAKLIQGDKVFLRSDALVGKRKMPFKWSDKVWTVTGQVADGLPVYTIADGSGKVEKVHRNRLLLVKAAPLVSEDVLYRLEPVPTPSEVTATLATPTSSNEAPTLTSLTLLVATGGSDSEDEYFDARVVPTDTQDATPTLAERTARITDESGHPLAADGQMLESNGLRLGLHNILDRVNRLLWQSRDEG